jgi:hypothetical protein
MHTWWYRFSTGDAEFQPIVGQYDQGASKTYWRMIADFDTSDIDSLACDNRDQNQLSRIRCCSGAEPAEDQWHSGFCQSQSTSSHEAWLNGVNNLTDSTTVDYVGATFDVTTWARWDDNTPAGEFDGLIAFTTIWSADIPDDYALELASGMWPSWVATEVLVGFWPVLGADSPELDVNAANDFTIYGDFSRNADGPPVYFPIGGI